MDVIFEDMQSDEIKSSETETLTIADTSSETSKDDENYTLIDTIVVPNNVKSFNCLDFDLKHLLTISPYGKSILKYYAKNNSLNFSLRTKLVNIIGRHLYTYILKHRLTHSQFLSITSKIFSFFPNECSSTYYIPAVPKTKSLTGEPLMAKGKLIDKCRIMLYKSNDKDYVRKRKHSSEINSEEEFEEKIFNKG